MVKTPIYMDHQATTPVDPRVKEAMIPFLGDVFGNAASLNHPFGKAAARAVDAAREQVRALIGAKQADEIVFTSGATESDNLAIKGAAEIYSEKGKHIITSSIEHRAVLDACRNLERKGFRLTILPVDSTGRVKLEQLEKALDQETILISIMAANNEVGVLQDLKAIGKLAKQHEILFHTDAAQAIGKVPIDVEAMGIDLLSSSGHKLYGPKGVGFLYVRKSHPRVRLAPQLEGGGHEGGFRSGTLNVPAIVGMGEACRIASIEAKDDAQRVNALADRLKAGLEAELDEIYFNGSFEHRLPGNLNISFAYVEGESLLINLSQDIACSSGSACMSATHETSHVLRAMGVREDLAHTALRFGIGRFNTEAEVDYVIKRCVDEVKKLREISPIYDLAKGR